MIRTNTAILISFIALSIGYAAGVFMSSQPAECPPQVSAAAAVFASPQFDALMQKNESMRAEVERSRQTLELAIGEIQSIRGERDLLASEVKFYEREWERTDRFLRGCR